MEQEAHFEEIHIWLKKVFLKHNPDPFANLKQEIEEEIGNASKEYWSSIALPIKLRDSPNDVT